MKQPEDWLICVFSEDTQSAATNTQSAAPPPVGKTTSMSPQTEISTKCAIWLEDFHDKDQIAHLSCGRVQCPQTH